MGPVLSKKKTKNYQNDVKTEVRRHRCSVCSDTDQVNLTDKTLTLTVPTAVHQLQYLKQ